VFKVAPLSNPESFGIGQRTGTWAWKIFLMKILPIYINLEKYD
jgi:hypothetical protein